MAHNTIVTHALLGKALDMCFSIAEEEGKLQLQQRNLREFPKIYENYDMEDVYYVDLSKNKLKKTPNELKSCRILRTLILHNNIITHFGLDFKFFTALRELDLSRNYLNIFPLIPEINSIEYLDISCNHLKELPDRIYCLSQIIVLKINSNYLSELPNTMGQLTNLRDLNASRNKLQRLPEELQICPLVKLDLSFNKLDIIPASFRHLSKLQEINLENNPLRLPTAKLCALGKAHIFKVLSLYASHFENDTDVSIDEKRLRKKYYEMKENRPGSTLSTFYEDFEFDPSDDSRSQIPSRASTRENRLEDDDVDRDFGTPDLSIRPEVSLSAQNNRNSKHYMDYYYQNHFLKHQDSTSSQIITTVSNGIHTPDSGSGTLSKFSYSGSSKRDSRNSVHYEADQIPVLSIYATLPHNYKRYPSSPMRNERAFTHRFSSQNNRSRPEVIPSRTRRNPFEFSTSEEDKNCVTENERAKESESNDEHHIRNQKLSLDLKRTSSHRSASTREAYKSGFTYLTAEDSNAIRRTSSCKKSNTNSAEESTNLDRSSNLQNHKLHKAETVQPPIPFDKILSIGSSTSEISDTPTPTSSPPPILNLSPYDDFYDFNNDSPKTLSPNPPTPPPRDPATSIDMSNDVTIVIESPFKYKKRLSQPIEIKSPKFKSPKSSSTPTDSNSPTKSFIYPPTPKVSSEIMAPPSVTKLVNNDLNNSDIPKTVQQNQTLSPFNVTKLSYNKNQAVKLSYDKIKQSPKKRSHVQEYFEPEKDGLPLSSHAPLQMSLTRKRKELNEDQISAQINFISEELNIRMGKKIEGDFVTTIQDGVLACQIVNLVEPSLVNINYPNENSSLSTKYVMLNVNNFIEGCQKVGVPSSCMCTPADIIHGQDISQVLKNFVYLLNSTTV